MALPEEKGNTIVQWLNATFNGKHFDFSYATMATAFFYGGAGFVAGFLLQKFGKCIVFTIIVGGAILYMLHHFNIIMLDIEQLRALLGLAQNDTISSVAQNYFNWMWNHLLYTVSAFLGFILGYKVG